MKNAIAMLVVLGMAGLANAIVVDDFESYAGGSNLVGQGGWVASDIAPGYYPALPGSLTVESALGYGGTNAAARLLHEGDSAAAKDLGVSLDNGWSVSAYVRSGLSGGNQSAGGEVWLSIGPSSITDGTYGNAPAYTVKMSPENRPAQGGDMYTFALVSTEPGDPVGHQVNSAFQYAPGYGDWVELRITVTTDANGIIGGSAAVRNITDGEIAWNDLGTFDAYAAGFGTGNTYVAIASYRDELMDNVSYEIPEPATMGLLAVGGLFMLGRRRQ